MSKLTYNNISLSQPKVSRDVKGDDEIFHEELRLQKKKKGGALIYRSGQAPAGYDSDEDQEDGDLLARKRRQETKVFQSKLPARPVIEKSTNRRGPRKIQTAQIIIADPDRDQDEDGGVKPKAEPVENLKIDVSKLEVQGEDSSDESSDEEVDNRRARARARFKQKAAEEEEKAAQAEEEEDKAKQAEEAAEESSEYETDTDESEEDEYTSRPLLKPVFVSARDRATVAERQRKEAEELEAQEALEKRAKQRKKESRMLVIREVEREEEAEKVGAGHGIANFEKDDDLPDDDDDVDEEEEIEKWKIRELKRIKRDKELDDAVDKENKDVERRRNMSDREVEAENAANPKKRREKGTMRYLQKYYHPGAYYQDDDEDGIRLQDFSQATGADRVIDRTLLPEVLQVKKFGLKSRTKYTHLVDQDTSGLQHKFKNDKQVFHNPWAASTQDPTAAPLTKKHYMGGTASTFSRPSKKSRKD